MVYSAFFRERGENRCFERIPIAMWGKEGNQLERSENQHSERISICIPKSERVFFYG